MAQKVPGALDVLICNLGVWEAAAFSDSYRFLEDDDDEIAAKEQGSECTFTHLAPLFFRSR